MKEYFMTLSNGVRVRITEHDYNKLRYLQHRISPKPIDPKKKADYYKERSRLRREYYGK